MKFSYSLQPRPNTLGLPLKFSAAILVACTASLLFALQADTPDQRTKVLTGVLTGKGFVAGEKSESLPLEDGLYQQARAVTVKVLSESPLGSGTIIQRQGSVYTAVTSKHVLRAGNSPYWIETADGQTYQAKAIASVELEGYDLALLQFRSTAAHAVARLGSSSTLEVGDEVFAAGFPWRLGSQVEAEFQDEGGFMLKMGRVSLLLEKALEEGYRIGYSNYLEKGMSGGPLLNRRGEVVGINGMHADPLWDAPDLYEDGSEPPPSLQPLIVSSNWAIPIEAVLKLMRSEVSGAKHPNTEILVRSQEIVAGMLSPLSFR